MVLTFFADQARDHTETDVNDLSGDILGFAHGTYHNAFSYFDSIDLNLGIGLDELPDYPNTDFLNMYSGAPTTGESRL